MDGGDPDPLSISCVTSNLEGHVEIFTKWNAKINKSIECAPN
jgi:hypothetical protein